MASRFEQLLREDLDPDDPGCRDPDFIREVAIPALTPLHRYYFRAEYEGQENVPATGPVMIVGNHSGGPVLPDLWVMLAIYWELFGLERPAYAMVHDIAFRAPLAGNFLLKMGGLRASPENAEKVLHQGGLLLVFPGGELDCLRSFWDRNVVNLHGRTGFIRLAMRLGVPIVPVVNVGGHETAFTLFSSQRLARWTGLQWLTRVKTLPVTVGLPWGIWPTGFVPFLPLPAKLSYKVGKPIHFRADPELAADPTTVRRAYHAIEGSMQDMVDELAARRRLPVIG